MVESLKSFGSIAQIFSIGAVVCSLGAGLAGGLAMGLLVFGVLIMILAGVMAAGS